MQVRYLDFGDVVPKTGIIGTARMVSWPVNGYRISLPRTIGQDDTLNPFEKVVLGIMRAERLRDPQRVAASTCLPTDFVEGVILNLRDHGLVDERNAITASGTSSLDDVREGLELRTAWVFRELVSGELMPFVYLPNNDNPPRWKKEPKGVKIWQLGTSNTRFGTPSADEVLGAMRETKRRIESYGTTFHLPRVNQIDVSTNPDRFQLDCPIVMPANGGRWRIADPFGYGYSRTLEKVFLAELSTNTGLQEWIMDWSGSLVVGAAGTADDSNAAYATESIRRLYPGLSQSLRIRRDGTRSVGQVYAAIEWALYYSCRLNGFDDKVAEIRFTSPKEQSELLKQAMAAIGCDGTGFVAPVGKAELGRYLRGSSEMRVVLPMSILQASDDPAHRLRNVCEAYPDFVARINRLKERRDAPLHGDEGNRTVKETSPDAAFMKDVVATLLPQIKFKDHPGLSDTTMDVFRNVNFNAENSLMGEFGPAVPYSKMARGTREALLSAERFWLTMDEEGDIQQLINEYCAALQGVLDAEIVSDRVKRPDARNFDPCLAASETANRLGLDELPTELMSAKSSYIADAAQGGGNHTLGPSLIVFLAFAEDERILEIVNSVPTFVDGICGLITLRGHGNGSIPRNREETGQYRKFVFDAIKAVLEV
ncbi:hypothetical protein GMI69_07630 [Eggerthellaceae bacterium zg-887]|uniref:hypothetical protein n=1 Tax=Xiamenia xianingshaonis TaxID=2682776 RepID=UPI00140C4B7A|nr:hypothetical protein [Xiamenia xianingshaonis]NHM16524.1 hypothetical protein [Xiamenia xianingshaonis]